MQSRASSVRPALIPLGAAFGVMVALFHRAKTGALMACAISHDDPMADHAQALQFTAAAFAEHDGNAAQAVRSLVVKDSPL